MNPILLDISMPIKTSRLLLRPPIPGDGAELNAAIIESFPELHAWMPWAVEKPTLSDSEENVRRAHADWILRKDLRILVFDQASGKLAGSTGLHRINWSVPSFEMGYWARTSFAGLGIITEAANALTRFAFTELKAKRVEIRCNPENVRSMAVIKRLGYEFEGYLRQNELGTGASGALRDTLIFSRIGADGLPELEVSW